MQYKACLPAVAVRGEDKAYTDAVAIGKLMNVKVSPTKNAVTVYGDDMVYDSVDTFTSAAVELGTTHLPIALEPVIFGNTVASGQSGTTVKIVDNENDNAPFVGFGFIVCKREDGKDVYISTFLPKVKFALANEEYETKGENIQFKTPTLSAVAYADENFNGEWRIRETSSTLAAAKTALATLLGGSITYGDKTVATSAAAPQNAQNGDD